MDRTGTRIIHVKHLTGYILKRWKLLLLGMFVGMCVFTMYGYMSIKRTQKPQTPVEKKTEVAISKIEFASVQGIIEYEEMLEEKQAYMEHSVLMQIDPHHKWSCSDVYTVSLVPKTTEMEGQKEGTESVQVGNNVSEKVNSMVGLFSEQSFWERLSHKTGDKMDVGYLREVVSSAGVSTDKFKVTVIHVDEEKVRELSDLVEQCLMEIAKEDSSFVGYALKNQKGNPIESVDNGLIDSQKNVQIQLMGIREGYVNREATLTDSAREYLEVYRKVKGQQNYEAGQPLEKNVSVEKKVLYVSFKTMKPYVVKGCWAGVFCVTIWLIGVYCFHPCILNPVNAKELFGLRVLNDKPENQINDREYLVMAAKIDVNVPEVCKGEMRVLLTGSVMNESLDDSIQKLKQQIEELGIFVVQSSFLKESPEEIKKLKQVEHIILVEQLEKTRFENLAWEVSLCEESRKEIAGVVFV